MYSSARKSATKWPMGVSRKLFQFNFVKFGSCSCTLKQYWYCRLKIKKKIESIFTFSSHLQYQLDWFPVLLVFQLDHDNLDDKFFLVRFLLHLRDLFYQVQHDLKEILVLLLWKDQFQLIFQHIKGPNGPVETNLVVFNRSNSIRSKGSWGIEIGRVELDPLVSNRFITFELNCI